MNIGDGHFSFFSGHSTQFWRALMHVQSIAQIFLFFDHNFQNILIQARRKACPDWFNIGLSYDVLVH